MATNDRLSQNCGSLFLLQFLTDCILFLIPVFEMLQELIEKYCQEAQNQNGGNHHIQLEDLGAIDNEVTESSS